MNRQTDRRSTQHATGVYAQDRGKDLQNYIQKRKLATLVTQSVVINSDEHMDTCAGEQTPTPHPLGLLNTGH